jgi:hypothetical protein
MAGYGNRTAMGPSPEGHGETRFGTHSSTEPYSGGHPDHKSGTVGGPGYGNKSAPDANPDGYDNSDMRFGTHSNTEPYSGGHPTHKSGTVGGAGFGNKTGRFAEGVFYLLACLLVGCWQC